VAQQSLAQGPPLLVTLKPRCTVFAEKPYWVVSSACVLEALE
jgi:hypothetical protein